MTAPHPAFGHLLPARGEKGYLPRIALFCCPSPRAAGRGWREAPGEGRRRRYSGTDDLMNALTSSCNFSREPFSMYIMCPAG